MRELIDTIKLPAVVLSVLTIVFCTAQRNPATADYLPPLDPQLQREILEAEQRAHSRYHADRTDTLAALGWE